MVRTRVEICGIDTSELPLLTNEVMKETFIRLQSGDISAREELVIGNLRLSPKPSSKICLSRGTSG